MNALRDAAHAIASQASAASAAQSVVQPASKPFAEIEGVSKVYPPRGKNAQTVALESVSCSFKAGQLVALLGPSGCGKTTLLRVVAGLTRPTTGVVRIDGQPITGAQRDFGIVFQSANLMPWRNVLTNVLFPMEILGRADAAAKSRARELLELVGLASFAEARPHELSGGMQQRVALCRALIHAPRLLLMDEPFGALDDFTRMEMHDLLLNVREHTRAAVMFVTHSISEAIYLSDQVLVFSRRPAKIAERIDIDLPYPRTQEMRFTPQFTAYERHASASLGVVKCQK
ncbi:Aliphatic sulfonates import ATP-binding protein SsuB [Pandoraea iniqua]|uniref:Aliphatic sulfonates import ATP-binding protein SsuB n=1 Tax=Pandoraea iniqua TaxID=2508288 RepID=A0A5E4ST20_9BURK|nr:ABC transporter ATP-binding protein [Pandoraea iniqua]VVD78231.1 Aliphatic sulfonates import ATP-binding protein SsuB [Pandoraea iniqua]